MAITIEQIHATADQLQQQGIKPTQVNVRETLGGGSFSTIAQALKSWRDGSKLLAPQGELVIPKAVSDKANGLVSQIWQTAQQEATRQMMIERDIYIAKENALMEQIEELQSVIATLERENDDLRATSHSKAPKTAKTADSSPAPTTPADPVTEPQDTAQTPIKSKGGRPKGSSTKPKDPSKIAGLSPTHNKILKDIKALANKTPEQEKIADTDYTAFTDNEQMQEFKNSLLVQKDQLQNIAPEFQLTQQQEKDL